MSKNQNKEDRLEMASESSNTDGADAALEWVERADEIARGPEKDEAADRAARRKQAERVAKSAEAAARKLLESSLEWDEEAEDEEAEDGRARGIVGDLARANGFSPDEARRAFWEALEPIRAKELMRLWDESARAPDAPARAAVVFGGGAIPQPNVRAMIAAAMVAPLVLFRPPATDPFLAPELARVMNSSLGKLHKKSAPSASSSTTSTASIPPIVCARWPRERPDITRAVLARAESFTLFGDRRAEEALRPMLAPSARAYVYGPRASAAVVDLDARAPVSARMDAALVPGRKRLPNGIDATMDRVAEDVSAYDQRGCLSPLALYLIGGGAGARGVETRAAAFEALARALDARLTERGPAPGMPASAASRIRSLRAVWIMDDGAGDQAGGPADRRRALMSPGLPGWTLLWDEADASPFGSPGYQTLRVIPMNSWADALASLEAAFRGAETGLQGVGIGPDPKVAPPGVLERLRALGAARVCPVGEMQSPPLDWTHDGNPLFPW